VTPSVNYLDCSHAEPQWITEDALADILDVPPSPNYVLVLWADEIVILYGSVADIRALLVRSLELLPTDGNNNNQN